MDPRKSRVDVNFYIDLLQNVLADAYRAYPEITSRELRLDMMSIRARVATEGFSFLTKTLPRLGKALVQGLETGKLIVPPEFSRKRKAGIQWNIPKLFSELFLTIFDRQGNLIHDTNTAVGFLRQLCLMCYKVEIPCTPIQALASIGKFKDIEKELSTFQDGKWTNEQLRYLSLARFFLTKLFSGFNPRDITPRHGPGSVADHGMRGRGKYEIYYYSRILDQLYPYVQYCTFGIHTQNLSDLIDHYKLTGVQPPARVVLVPKDSRGPRIISCEPALLQYLQQGLARKIYWLVEHHKLTRACVHFTDQQPNRRAAMRASIDTRYATIDMADASDRVSCKLVESIFPDGLLPYLLGTRSEVTLLPNGELLPLRKFAPMGSALCFPIEALTFCALAFAALWPTSRRRGMSRPNILVFGDDLIVKSKDVERVISVLELFSLKVNRDKCFSQGKFRESCGCDAFNGEDVTPVKIRALRMQDRNRDLEGVYSLSKNASAFFDKGYWMAAEFLWKYCERFVGPLPTTSPSFAGISRTSTILPPVARTPKGVRTRWRKDLQKVEIKSLRLISRKERSLFPSDASRLGHNLLQGMPEPYDDFVAVPHSALTKAGWFAA